MQRSMQNQGDGRRRCAMRPRIGRSCHLFKYARYVDRLRIGNESDLLTSLLAEHVDVGQRDYGFSRQLKIALEADVVAAHERKGIQLADHARSRR